MASVPPLPDAAALVAGCLREDADVQAVAGRRVFTSFPKQVPATAPFVLVTRIGGPPPISRPLVVDLAVIQLDAYGGTQAVAHVLAALCRAALADLSGEQPNGAGNVCAVIAGALRYVPDETYKPPRPRYVADMEVTVKTATALLAVGST